MCMCYVMVLIFCFRFGLFSDYPDLHALLLWKMLYPDSCGQVILTGLKCDSGTSMDAVRIGRLFVMPWELVLMLTVIFKQLHSVTFVLVTLREPWISGQEP